MNFDVGLRIFVNGIFGFLMGRVVDISKIKESEILFDFVVESFVFFSGMILFGCEVIELGMVCDGENMLILRGEGVYLF